MWKLKVSSKEGPFSQWLSSTNNFAGRQIWEYDPDAGILEDRAEIDKARQLYFNNRLKIAQLQMVQFAMTGDAERDGVVLNQEDLYFSHTLAQNLLWDSIHNSAEPLLTRWPFSKSLCMLASWMEDPNSDAFKKHLARVPDHLWLAEEGLRMHSIGSQTWDTALSLQALLASDALIDELGPAGILRKGYEFMKSSQIKDNRQGDFRKMYNHVSKGAWAFSDRDHGLQVSDCTAEALMCCLLFSQMGIEIDGNKIPVESLYDSVEFLFSLQSPNGGLAVWEPARSPEWLEVI
ncbi:hypothetical protein C5167_030028 [Papaver somniferum]|nr:hypothetical protein C5167_030028 [Papaver somniferum]